MFKRFLCCFTACLLGLLLSLSGCGKGGDAVNPSQIPSNAVSPSQEPITHSNYPDPGIPPLLIMADGILYQLHDSLDCSSTEIEDKQILGNISKVVWPWPLYDGEANFGQAGTPYARCPLEEYPDGIVVFFAHQWHIFLPLDS